MLYVGDKAVRPLNLEDLENLYRNGDIEWPKITESEIQDRSKGDALSKGIVALQTSWFLIQCIVRGSTGLVVTELELLTLAFASLNVVTYFFWWNKPVDVRHPHPVHSKSSARHPRNYFVRRAQGESPSDSQLELASLVITLLSPALFVMRGLRHIVRAITGKTSKSERVSTFYAATLSPDPHTFFWMTVACSALGSIFGGVHCVAWSFQFPSHQEQVLWRISSMVITCGPIFIALLSHCLRVSRSTLANATPGDQDGYFVRPWSWSFWFLITAIQVVVLVIFVVVYIAARFVLLVQACMTLRKLSPGALQAMEWTNFVPHF